MRVYAWAGVCIRGTPVHMAGAGGTLGDCCQDQAKLLQAAWLTPHLCARHHTHLSSGVAALMPGPASSAAAAPFAAPGRAHSGGCCVMGLHAMPCALVGGWERGSLAGHNSHCLPSQCVLQVSAQRPHARRAHSVSRSGVRACGRCANPLTQCGIVCWRAITCFRGLQQVRCRPPACRGVVLASQGLQKERNRQRSDFH